MLARVSKKAILRTINLKSNIRCLSLWSNVELGPKDPILGVAENFKADSTPDKINVGIGAYRDDDGNPVVLDSVQAAQKKIMDMNMEYSPISGIASFVKKSVELAYGPGSEVLESDRVAALQSISGTGALRLSANFLGMWNPSDSRLPVVMLPNPTWGNHFPIYEHAGLETKVYRYWDQKTLGLDQNGLLEDLSTQQSCNVVLHACAHNPTGVDPTTEQWKEISQVCKEKGHFVIFDNAYQGFASGDTDKDIESVRIFVEDGHKIGLCQSFAKNFGLYGQRIGCFSMVCEDSDEKARVESQLKIIARAIYSNPPLHGARIVDTILDDPSLKATWQSEIEMMSNRIIRMRELLKENLVKAGSTLNWDHITNQIGMFSYTGVTPEQCDILTNKHHIYLTRNGRISMAGVTSGNVEKLAFALHDVTKSS